VNQLYIFSIANRFNMGYSPVAKLIRSRVSDTMRAENLFILVSASIVIALMLVNQFAWALIRNDVMQHPTGDVAISYWLCQLGFASLFLFTCIIGFKPAATITCTKSAVNIQQGKTQISVPYTAIETMKTVSDMTFHRHYRLYKNTFAFVNEPQQDMVLLRTKDHPIVLGLNAKDVNDFMQHIEAQRTAIAAPVSFEFASKEAVLV
jgi:hypothetical protein